MKKIITFLFFICVAISVSSIYADRRTYYYPGVSGYGVGNGRVITCPHCGKTYDSTSSHMCSYETGSTRRSRSSGSSTAEDRAAQGAISGDPTLLVNQTSYTPVDFNSYSSENNSQNGYSNTNSNEELLSHFPSLHKKRDNTTRNTIIIIGVIMTCLWLLSRRKKKQNSKRRQEKISTSDKTISTSDACNKQPVATSTSNTDDNPSQNTDSKISQSRNTKFVKKSILSVVKDVNDKTKDFIATTTDSPEFKNLKDNINKGINTTKNAVQKKIQEHNNRSFGTQHTSVTDELTKLNALRQSDAITDEEYHLLKKQILDKTLP